MNISAISDQLISPLGLVPAIVAESNERFKEIKSPTFSAEMPMKILNHKAIESVSTCYWLPDISIDESSEALRALADGKRYNFGKEGKITLLADFDEDRKKYTIRNFQADKNFEVKESTRVINQDGSFVALPKNFKAEDRIQALERFFKGEELESRFDLDQVDRSNATDELIQKATDISRNIDRNEVSHIQNQTVDNNAPFGAPFVSSTPSALKPSIRTYLTPGNRIDFYMGKELAPNENQLVGLNEGNMRAGTLTPTGTIRTAKQRPFHQAVHTEPDQIAYKSSITLLDQESKFVPKKPKRAYNLDEETDSDESIPETPVREYNNQTNVRFNLPKPKTKPAVFQREPVHLRPRPNKPATKIRTANLDPADLEKLRNLEPRKSAFNMRQIKLNDSQLDTENFNVNPPKEGEDWLEFTLRVEQDLEAHILYLQTSVDDEIMGDGFDVKSVIRRIAFFIRNFNLLKSQTGKRGKSVQIIGAMANSIAEMIQLIFDNFEDKNGLLARMENEIFDRDTQNITIFLAKLAHRLKFVFGTVERSMFDRLCFKAFRFDERLAEFYKTRFYFRTGTSFDLKKTTDSISDFLATDIHLEKNVTKKKTQQMSHRMRQNNSQVNQQIDLLSDCVATLARETNSNDSNANLIADLRKNLNDLNRQQADLADQVTKMKKLGRQTSFNYQLQTDKGTTYQEAARAAVLNSTEEIKNQLRANGSLNINGANGKKTETFDVPYVDIRKKEKYQESVVKKHIEFFTWLMKLYNGRLNKENLPNHICKLCFHDHLTKQHANGVKFRKFYPDGYRNHASDDADLDSFGKNIPTILDAISKN